MPGYADIVRAGMKLADKQTDSLQPKIQLYHYVSQTGDGDVTYNPPLAGAGELVPALVDYKQQQRMTADGSMVLSKAYVFFPRPMEIDPRDKIVLPDGTTGDIIPTAGLADKDTGKAFYKEVWLQ